MTGSLVVRTSSHSHAPTILELVAEMIRQEQSARLMPLVADVGPLEAAAEVQVLPKLSRMAKQEKLRAKSSFKKSFFFMQVEMAPLKSSQRKLNSISRRLIMVLKWLKSTLTI